MDYYNNTSPLEFISDVYDIMKDGDCLSPEKLNADVVDMLGKYLSAQQSVQATGLCDCVIPVAKKVETSVCVCGGQITPRA